MKHCVCSGPIGGLPGWHCGVMLFEEVVKDKNAGRAWGQVTKWPDTRDQSAGPVCGALGSAAGVPPPPPPPRSRLSTRHSRRSWQGDWQHRGAPATPFLPRRPLARRAAERTAAWEVPKPIQHLASVLRAHGSGVSVIISILAFTCASHTCSVKLCPEVNS